MPATFSVNIGTTTESLRKPDITSVLIDLPDNTQKLISPKDVRDAFLSTWANSAFKQTIGTASVEYIGIDSGNPDNRDIKEKIFIGKRNYTGTDIMNTTLLSSDTDIYLFNTKSDSATQSETKISILAGTNSSLYANTPYVSVKTNNTDNGFNMDFVNPSTSGPINVYSQTGRVAVNGILFPTISETSGSASNGRLLQYSGTYPNGSLRWVNESVTITDIGTPGIETNIYGSPSNVNGYSLEFVDEGIVPQTIGGIEMGTSFSAFSFNNGIDYQNWPLSEVIRKLLYPYVPPTLSLSINNPITGTIYTEVGVTQSFDFDYSITRYSYDISTYSVTGTTYCGTFSGSVGQQLTGSFTYEPSPIIYTGLGNPTQSFALTVSDNTALIASYSATASIQYVVPFFYSFYPIEMSITGNPVDRKSKLNTYLGSSSTNKSIYPYPGISQSIELPYSGSDYITFVMSGSYSLLSQILDPNGYIIHSSSDLSDSTFTYSVPTETTIPPYGNLIIYQTSATCSYSAGGTFKFIFQ